MRSEQATPSGPTRQEPKVLRESSSTRSGKRTRPGQIPILSSYSAESTVLARRGRCSRSSTCSLIY